MSKMLTAVALGCLVGLAPLAASAQTVLSGGDYVKAHNDLRAKHCVAPLKKSAKLEAESRKWALEQAKADEFEHDKNRGSVGENLYSASKSPETFDDDAAVHRGAAEAWYGEIKDYKFDSARPHADKTGVVGHFTQLVWKASTEVGCANVSYAAGGMNKVISVCRYAPAGNDVSDDGALYKINVPKPCK